MKHILRTLILLLAAPAFGQQPAAPPYAPGSTPPTFPPDLYTSQQMPPDTKAPPPQRVSNVQIERQIQDRVDNEPELANTNVSVKSDAKSVQLSGVVDTDHQRDLVRRIARAYGSDRKLVDKLKLRRP